MNLALLICIVGLLVWVIASGRAPSPTAEIGRDMFWVGLLAFLLGSAHSFGSMLR